MFHTALCDMLGIKYPILQGGMAYASLPEMVAIISEAGGLGIIGAGRDEPEVLRQKIKRTRELTKKPFAVNIVPLEVSLWDRVDLLIDEKINIVTTAFGDPREPIVRELKKHGMTVLSVVPSVRLAVRMAGEGADAVIASGCEGGGHVGKVATLALVPQVVDAVNIPVVAAGGFGDARGFVAALALGACGIQMGTRFLATHECNAHDNYKQCLIKATEEDTVVTGMLTGKPARVLRNKLAEEFLRREDAKATKEELEILGVGRLQMAIETGDVDNGTMAAGQVAGMIKEIKGVKELIEEIIEGAKAICSRLALESGSFIRV